MPYFFTRPCKSLIISRPIRKKYKEFIGPTFLILSVLISLNSILFVYEWIERQFRFNRIKREIVEDITNLTYQEKCVLREFYLVNTDTLDMPLHNPTVAGLVNKYILYQVGTFGGISYREPCLNYAITKTAKKIIRPDLIDLPLTLTDRDHQYLRENRPEWIKESPYRW